MGQLRNPIEDSINVAVTAILGVLAIIFVGLRVYCRAKLTTVETGPDEWCMVLALFLSTGVTIVTACIAATAGSWSSPNVPSAEEVVFGLKVVFAVWNAQVAAMGLVKVSLVLYYKRIFTLTIFKLYANILVTLISGFTISMMVSMTFSKKSVRALWDRSVPFRLDIVAIAITICVGNVVFDLLTLCLPLTAVCTLQMSKQRKMTLSIIFTLGSFCMIASLIRLVYAAEWAPIDYHLPYSFFGAPFFKASLWAVIEISVFIIAGCLLTLGPLFRSSNKVFRSSRRRRFSSFFCSRSSTVTTTMTVESQNEKLSQSSMTSVESTVKDISSRNRRDTRLDNDDISDCFLPHHDDADDDDKNNEIGGDDDEYRQIPTKTTVSLPTTSRILPSQV